MRCTSAYSRHAARTGHSPHTRCAVSTPVPSDGKNSAGLTPRHRAWNIHAYSSGVSMFTSTDTTVRPYVVLGSHPAACDAVCTPKVHIVTRTTTLGGSRKLRATPVSRVSSVNSQLCEETLKTARC